MHFYYLDEAGCSGGNLSDQQQPIFVLGGLSVSDEKWIATHERIQDVSHVPGGGGFSGLVVRGSRGAEGQGAPVEGEEAKLTHYAIEPSRVRF
jgi:hypothetical protein